MRSFASQGGVAVRAIALVLAGLVLLASLRVSLSLSGRLLVLFQLILVVAICAPKLSARMRLCGVLICAAILFVVGSRATHFPGQPRNGELYHYPARIPSSVFSRLVLEEDGVFVATSLFSAVGEITARESEGIWPALKRQYDFLRERHGQFATPLIRTYLGLQRTAAFEMLHLEAEAPNPAKRSLVFLHGFGGNWSLLCFIVAEAVSPIGIDTFCPSTGPFGDWSSDTGREILRQSLQEIRAQGYLPLLLGGLSAGAISVGMIAKDLAPDFQGLIFLFGGHPDAELVALPSLYIYGTHDERFPFA